MPDLSEDQEKSLAGSGIQVPVKGKVDMMTTDFAGAHPGLIEASFW